MGEGQAGRLSGRESDGYQRGEGEPSRPRYVHRTSCGSCPSERCNHESSWPRSASGPLVWDRSCRRGALNAALNDADAPHCVHIRAGQSWFSRRRRTSQYPSEPPCFIAFADKVMTSRTPDFRSFASRNRP